MLTTFTINEQSRSNFIISIFIYTIQFWTPVSITISIWIAAFILFYTLVWPCLYMTFGRFTTRVYKKVIYYLEKKARKRQVRCGGGTSPPSWLRPWLVVSQNPTSSIYLKFLKPHNNFPNFLPLIQALNNNISHFWHKGEERLCWEGKKEHITK